MSSRVLSTALLLLASLPCYAGPKPCDLPQRPQVDCVMPAHPVLVGEIIIVGNTATPNDLILSRLPFATGQLLNYPTLKMAEDNLSRLDIFHCDPDGTGIRPTVTVLDPDGPAVVKDILVEVQERCGAIYQAVEFEPCIVVQEEKTGSLLFGLGVNSDCNQAVVYGCSSPCGGGSAKPSVCGGPTCDADKPACACEKDCSCCGCQKVQDDEDIESVVNCNCGEGCKCCGCKKTIAASSCATANSCAAACSCAVAPRIACGDSTCDADKPACSCEKDCSCCGCQKAQGSDDLESVVNCNCGEGCKCCNCKKTIAANDCCPFSSDCCVSGAVGCLLLEHCCPTLKVCGMCPVVQIQVRQVMQPCMKQFFSACKQLFKQKATGCSDCSDCCSEKVAEKKASKCGACKQHIRVEIRVCPWTGEASKQACGFVWKKGKKFEQLTVMPKEEAVKQAAVACPYRHQQEVDRLEKKQPRRAGMVVTPLENLAKMQKAQAIMRLADFLYESGKYDMAVKRYRKVMELVPGSQWDVQAQDSIVMAQAMKGIDEWYAQFGQQVLEAHLEEMKKSATEEAEPIQVKPLPCEPQNDDQALQEFKERFCALLDQARCAVEAGDVEIAKSLVREASQLQRPEVAALLDAAQQCIAAGCCEEAWDKVNHVLMLDPNCMAAQDLQRQLIDIAANQCDQCPFTPGCEQEEPPCGGDEAASYDPLPCPGIGFRHELPGVDPTIVEVMERVLIECARPDRYDYDGDCEEQSLEIDDEACELELLEDVDFCQPIDPAQLGKLLHRFDESVQDCVESAGKWTKRIEVVRFGQVECALTMEKDGACCVVVSIHPRDAQDLRKWQQVYHKAVRNWVEQMSGRAAGNDDDTEESEEPLFELETDLDPDW
jgi:hypothetical protein